MSLLPRRGTTAAMLRHRLFTLALATATSLQAQQPTRDQPAYDPLQPTVEAGADLRLTVDDASRQRQVPLRVYLPGGEGRHPVLLLSHGLGGTRDTCSYLGDHWRRRGYVVVAMQHPGSDDSVWRGVPMRERRAALEHAADGENLRHRCLDVRLALDTLARWQDTADHPLRGRLDLEHVGMSGHSFGALTTQATSGQSMPLLGTAWTDTRIDAALAMSPSSPRAGDPQRAFAKVGVPWLLMTGTHDDSPIGGQTPASRRGVFPALPPSIDRYELLLDGAEHSAFTDRGLAGDVRPRDPAHHRSILAVSTAFWDTHLRGEPEARAWLHGAEARTAMAAADGWQVALRQPDPAAAGREPREPDARR